MEDNKSSILVSAFIATEGLYKRHEDSYITLMHDHSFQRDNIFGVVNTNTIGGSKVVAYYYITTCFVKLGFGYTVYLTSTDPQDKTWSVIVINQRENGLIPLIAKRSLPATDAFNEFKSAIEHVKSTVHLHSLAIEKELQEKICQ